ncbi:MAG: TRAP transporter large permease subunit [Bacillota bacterium]|jgi:tripartite ATP-independent transporter DctM subunit
MEKDGSGAADLAAVTAASSVIGPMIPPSIIMVICGSMMGVSIAALFAGGIIPGLLVALALMVYNHFISAKRGYSRAERRPTLKESVKDIPPSLTALAMPAVILGGILFGVFTPTEAAAVAVVYAFVVAVWKRTLSAEDLVPMLGRTCSTVGMILLVMGAASISQPAAS